MCLVLGPQSNKDKFSWGKFWNIVKLDKGYYFYWNFSTITIVESLLLLIITFILVCEEIIKEKDSKFYGLLLYILISLAVSKLFSLTSRYALNNRLHDTCHIVDIPLYAKYLQYCYKYIISSFALSITFPITAMIYISLAYNITSEYSFIYLYIWFYFLSSVYDIFVMGANLLFIKVNTSVCTKMVILFIKQ
jgi:hypothetical protein